MPRRVQKVIVWGCLGVGGLGLGAQGVQAQVVVPTGQTREVRGESTWTDAAGNVFESGELVSAAPEGFYGPWISSVPVPGFISGMGMLESGFDGVDTFTIHAVAMNLGGGNGPGTSAAASLEIEFSNTFDVSGTVSYTANAGLGVAGPSMAPDTTANFSGVYTLTGPGGEVFRYETGPDNGYSISVVDVTGTLPAGSYTLSLVLSGEVSFFSLPDDPDGNGAGGGAGGGSPLMTFRVEEAACPADWNDDATVNSGDISAFLTSWLASVQAPDLTGDFNGDGATNSGDISAFLTAWLTAVQEGC